MIGFEEPVLVLLIHGVFKVSCILYCIFLLLRLTELLLQFLLLLGGYLLASAMGLLVFFGDSRMRVAVQPESDLKSARKG